MSFNVLADAYRKGYGDYSHVPPELLEQGARLPRLVQIVNSMNADVICLQEAEPALVGALENHPRWQLFWTHKQNKSPDGCLTLVRRGIRVTECESRAYSDGSGHIAQLMEIGGVTFVNTHIKWAAANARVQSGTLQMDELLGWLGDEQPAVILADCNDRPGGLVRALFEEKGFTNVCGDEPTAFVKQQAVALDVIAARGVETEPIETDFRAGGIPTRHCPSDHIPVMAWVDVN